MTHRTFIAAFLAVALLAPISAGAKVRQVRAKAAPFSATISRAADGDTIFLKKSDGSEVKCRLHYADAPEVAHSPKETDQPGGHEALEFVQKHWQGKAVTATQHGVSYGRPIVDVVETVTGKNLGLDLVQMGLAQVDPRFHPPQAFKDAQAAAEEKRIGIWHDTVSPVPPWTWRKQSRNKQEKH